MNHSPEYFHNLKAKLIKDFDDYNAKRNGVDCSACKSVFSICGIHTQPDNTECSGLLRWLLRVVHFVERYSEQRYSDSKLVTKNNRLEGDLSSYKSLLEDTRDECSENDASTNFSRTILQTFIRRSTNDRKYNHGVVKDMVNDLIHLTADLMVNYREDNWFDTYSAEHPEISTKDLDDDDNCERAKVNKTLQSVFDKLREQRSDECKSNYDYNRTNTTIKVTCHDGFIMEGKTSAVRENSKRFPSMFSVDSECDLFYRLKPKSLDDCIGVSRPEYITVFAAYFYAISIVTNEVIIDNEVKLDLNRSHISHEVFQLRSKAKFDMENYLYSILHQYHYDKDIEFLVRIYSLPIDSTDDNFCQIKVPWPIKDYRNFEQQFYKTREQLRLAYGNFYFQYDIMLEKLCNNKTCVCASCCQKKYTAWFFIKGGEKALFKGISAADKRWLFTTFAFTDPACNTNTCTIPKPPVRRSSSI